MGALYQRDARVLPAAALDMTDEVSTSVGGVA